MSGTAEVMQEYLIKLGYKTDMISLRKFEDSISSTGKRIFKLGGAVAGMVVSMEAASAAFAYAMRKTYFGAELANTSVKNINAMTYAGKQFGISGDSMAGAIKGMAQAMRLNPGLQGLVESFGIKVTGRDTSDVMLDFVKSLKDMPQFVGQQYASLFGIDPDTYHQMINHYDELKSKRNELLNQYQAAGIDPDAAKAMVLEYTGAIDELKSKFDMLTLAMMTKFMPQFKNITAAVNSAVNYWIRWAQGIERVSGLFDNLSARGVWNFLGDLGGKSAAERKVDELYGKKPTGSVSKDEGKKILSQIEKQYGLPSGLLYGQWGQESGYGAQMTSPKGAQGHFQFMPSTAKEFGLRDPNDFRQSADAAARKMQGLIKRYGGDVNMALAAYNWGEGNLDKKGIAGAPQETQEYVQKITGTRLGGGGTGGTISQTNNVNINVTGQGAEQIANAVGKQQSRVLGNATRQLVGNPG